MTSLGDPLTLAGRAGSGNVATYRLRGVDFPHPAAVTIAGRWMKPHGAGKDVEAISALNKNQRTGPDPDKFDMIG
jgi:hypothetical protein